MVEQDLRAERPGWLCLCSAEGLAGMGGAEALRARPPSGLCAEEGEVASRPSRVAAMSPCPEIRVPPAARHRHRVLGSEIQTRCPGSRSKLTVPRRDVTQVSALEGRRGA